MKLHITSPGATIDIEFEGSITQELPAIDDESPPLMPHPQYVKGYEDGIASGKKFYKNYCEELEKQIGVLKLSATLNDPTKCAERLAVGFTLEQIHEAFQRAHKIRFPNAMYWDALEKELTK